MEGRGEARHWRARLSSVRATVLAAMVAGSTLVAAGPLAPSALAGDCGGTSIGEVPINDLGGGSYQGFQAGLYPGGSNLRPPSHDAAGLDLAKNIVPLDTNGSPDPVGKYVLVSIGMSNTNAEFEAFMPLADADPSMDPRLVLVNGAQGGHDAREIANPADEYWTILDQRLADAGVSPNQVAVAWVKQAIAHPKTDFPAHPLELQGYLKTITEILKQRYPNMGLAYYSSRSYGGYATTTLNPEPYAYWSGFSTKWVIEEQISGSPELNFDPADGPVRAPWMAWGPYFWADGLTSRSDGLTWACEEFRDDGTHLTVAGQDKVARMLLDFFNADVTGREWFVADTDPPGVTIESGPPNPTAQTSATFSFSASEPLVSFACALDGGQSNSCTSPVTYPDLADGPHIFSVQATDSSGNTGAPTVWNWTVETTGPITTITSGPSDPSADASATFSFSADEPSTFACAVDGGSAEPCSSPITYSGLAEGPHSFSVQATDEAGNTGAPTTWSWTVDSTPPALTPGGLAMFDTDRDGKADQVQATFSEPLAPYSAGSLPWTLEDAPSGGSLAVVTVIGSTAFLSLAEGAGGPDTSVGSFTVSLAPSPDGIRDGAGNQAAFPPTAPSDIASPVPVAVVDSNGSKDGRMQVGDTLSVTFSESLAASSVPAISAVTEADPVGTGKDTLSISGVSAGPLDTGSDLYLKSNGGSATYGSSSVGLSNGSKTVTVTIAGACSGSCRSISHGGPGTFVFVPAVSLQDGSGNPAVGALSGSSFRIF
jgi:hypothetical protein